MVQGHSSVYHPGTRTVLVFGGMRPFHARYSERANVLFAYHIDLRYWTMVCSRGQG